MGVGAGVSVWVKPVGGGVMLVGEEVKLVGGGVVLVAEMGLNPAAWGEGAGVVTVL